MKSVIKEKQFNNFKWIDVLQPSLLEINEIAQQNNLDVFQIKDSIEAGHLPKFETHEQYKFLILRAYTAEKSNRTTNVSELSNKIAFFYKNDILITVHKMDFKFLEEIKDQYFNTEELLFSIIKKMLSSFDLPSESLSKKIDVIEQNIFLKNNSKTSLEELYYIKTKARISKKLLLISQNVIHQIEIDKHSKSAHQDVKDKLISLLLNYDEILENANNLLNTYLSVNAQKNNEVVKLLTIFSAFFLPLTFIVGIYGMNFKYMPEIDWKYGYFMVLIFMVLISILIYYWFKRKKIV